MRNVGIENKENIKLLSALATVLITVGILIFTSGCGTSDAAVVDQPDPAEQSTAPHPVKVAEATSGDVEELVSRVSTISAPKTVNVLPKTRGLIVALEVEEGSRVKAGQLIAKLEGEQQRLEEERTKAVRDKALHDKDLAARKLEKEIIGREEYLEYLHSYEQAERDFQRAGLERKKTDILAPIEGVVSHRHVSLGDTVFESTPIVTIADLESLETEVLVPQDQIDRVGIGNQVILNPGGNGNRKILGEVIRISPVIETQSGTVKVVVQIRPGQKEILPGQFVKAHIITGIKRGVTLVPRDAIAIENAMSVLYKVVDGFARRIPVKAGFGSGERIEVSGEVKAGDQVVVAGKSGLNDMTSVRILDAGTAGSS